MSITITIVIEEKANKKVTIESDATKSGHITTEKEIRASELIGCELINAINKMSKQSRGNGYAH
ncbi:hypothetical protein [Providencia rettgeri]|uniref:hypothetical protein n=1 Tax=Providencia rettgeri TaxID=587 RepID=UPI003019AE49